MSNGLAWKTEYHFFEIFRDIRTLLKYDFYKITWKSVDNWGRNQRKRCATATALNALVVAWGIYDNFQYFTNEQERNVVF